MARKGKAKRRKSAEDEGDSGGQLAFTTTGSAALQQIPNPFATPHQAHNSPSDPRYLTRSSLSLLAQCTLRTSSRYALRNVKREIPDQSETLAPPSTGLVETSQPAPDQSETLAPPSTGLVETTSQPALTSHDNFNSRVPLDPQLPKSAAASSKCPNPHEKSTPTLNGMEKLANGGKSIGNSISLQSKDWSLPTSNQLLDLKSFASNFLTPNQGSEDLRTFPPHSAAHEVASELHVPLRDAITASTIIGNRTEGSGINYNEQVGCLSRSSSFNYTQIAEMLDDSFDEVASAVDPALVTVEGYRVKEEMAPLLRSIFSKYGDIAKDCSLQSIKSRSIQLETVCSIYKNLEKRKPTEISVWEINNVLAEVADLEFVKVEVGWLRQRLEVIGEALKKANGYTSLKEEKARKSLQAEMHQKVLEESLKRTKLLESEVNMLKAEVQQIDETIMHAKGKMLVFKQALVSGLL